MFWTALAAQLSAPEPFQRGSWFSDSDMPSYIQTAGISRRVLTRLLVSPDGKVESCSAEVSSGEVRVDRDTCSLMMERTKFRPARWTDGSPVYGVYRLVFDWTVGPRLPGILSDLELTVAALPKGAHSPATVRVMFAVDEVGKPSSCTAEITPGIPKANWALAPVACAEIVKRYSAIPARDTSGRAVRSVQDATVNFVKE